MVAFLELAVQLRKNILATMTQQVAISALVTVLWFLVGYSLAFGVGGNAVQAPSGQVSFLDNSNSGAVLATATVLLLAGAASLETWCTPHRHTRPDASQAEVDTVREPHRHVDAGGCLRHGFCAGDGHTAARSPAPFPSLRSVPLGRLAGADRATSTHRPPQGGIT